MGELEKNQETEKKKEKLENAREIKSENKNWKRYLFTINLNLILNHINYVSFH